MTEPRATNQTILIVGAGGGREHALVWKLAQSPRVDKLYIAPGNGGANANAEPATIDTTDIDALIAFAREHAVDLTVAASDDVLAAGIVDRFTAAGLRIFGSSQAAAQIEASKAYSKTLMTRQHVPTARYQVFDDQTKALAYLKTQKPPLVVKASGLALGKGVFICHTAAEARQAVTAIMGEKLLGSAGAEVVIEDFLVGQEVSIHALCDGRNYVLFPPSQDHKTIYEGDKGPNTGGIGVIVPVPWVTPDQMSAIGREVVEPILEGLEHDNRQFSGCLYPGLKMTNQGPQVLEFNARFGDPETQPYLRLLKTDLLDLLEACLEQRLDTTPIEWHDGFAACVVITSGGYPEKYRKGLPISGLEAAAADPHVVVFHANTTRRGNTYYTNGGRVLAVTATGATLKQALNTTYAAVAKIHFDGMYYRRDIGAKALAASPSTAA